jgi:hypothetical protein
MANPPIATTRSRIKETAQFTSCAKNLYQWIIIELKKDIFLYGNRDCSIYNYLILGARVCSSYNDMMLGTRDYFLNQTVDPYLKSKSLKR